MRIGFAPPDIRRMDMDDFIAYTDVVFGEDRRARLVPATQQEIDAFMG